MANNKEVDKSRRISVHKWIRVRNSMVSVVFPNCTLGERYLLLVNAVQNLPEKPVNIRQIKNAYKIWDINVIYVKVFWSCTHSPTLKNSLSSSVNTHLPTDYIRESCLFLFLYILFIIMKIIWNAIWNSPNIFKTTNVVNLMPMAISMCSLWAYTFHNLKLGWALI